MVGDRSLAFKLLGAAVILLVALYDARSEVASANVIEQSLPTNTSQSKVVVSSNMPDVRESLNMTLSRPHTSSDISDVSNMTGSPSNMTTSSNLLPCPMTPPNLRGPIKVLTHSYSLKALESFFPTVQRGGRHRPEHCRARDRVAIIVPYRDRQRHLSVLLANLHPLLQRQQLDYWIFVVEQSGMFAFNRATLLNIGFVESSAIYNFDCFIFHDVDLLPEDDRNLYRCPVNKPRHLSAAIDTTDYQLQYHELVGGVTAFTGQQFRQLNGYSNVFWGWGGEDDDMYNRIKDRGYGIARYPIEIARYMTLPHAKATPNPLRFKKLSDGSKRFTTDGLNSLRYSRTEVKFEKLFTLIVVELGRPSDADRNDGSEFMVTLTAILALISLVLLSLCWCGFVKLLGPPVLRRRLTGGLHKVRRRTRSGRDAENSVATQPIPKSLESERKEVAITAREEAGDGHCVEASVATQPIPKSLESERKEVAITAREEAGDGHCVETSGGQEPISLDGHS